MHILDLRTLSHTLRHPLQEVLQSSDSNANIIMALLGSRAQEVKSIAPGYTVKGKSLDSHRSLSPPSASRRESSISKGKVLLLQRPQEGSSFTAAAG